MMSLYTYTRRIFSSCALAVIFAALLIPVTGFGAAGDCVSGTKGCTYLPLTTIPGAFTEKMPTNPFNVVKNIYGVAIGVAAVLAVGMIIWAGLQYATTEAINGKSDAKDTWQGAVWGLVLLLSSFLILRTINVDLVDITLDLGTPIKGDAVDPNFLQNSIQRLEEAANLTARINQIHRDEVAVAEKRLAAAQAANDPIEIAAAQNQLTRARDAANSSQINAKHDQASVNATKAIKDGEYDKAIEIYTTTLQQEQAAANSITDPASKTEAQNRIILNTQIARVNISSINMLKNLQNGTYPAYGGAGKFQGDRAKFLSETNQVANELLKTSPQLAAEYRQHTVAQLNAIDAQWMTNLKKCTRGYTVMGGCNQ
jgi:hypothetical protein